MTRINKFADAFWGPDFCSTAGLDALIKRMKEGRQMCKDFEEYLKARAKIEDEYCKSLQRLTKNSGGNMEIGTLKKAWDSLKIQTEKTALEHQDASRAMVEASNRMNDFMEYQKNIRKQEETNVIKVMKKKQDLHKKASEAKKVYDNKFKEQEQIDLNVNTVKNAGISNIPTKEWEKLYSKQGRMRQELDRTEQTYRNCVDSLEQTRQQWEKEMTHTCDTFQQLEENRIAYLRNEMWVYSNILSQTCVDDDEHYEAVRKALEVCDIDTDIELFITEKKTGTEHPAPVLYEPNIPGSLQEPKPKQPEGLIRRLPPPMASSEGSPRAPPPRRMHSDSEDEEVQPYASFSYGGHRSNNQEDKHVHFVVIQHPTYSAHSRARQPGNSPHSPATATHGAYEDFSYTVENDMYHSNL